MNLKNGKSMNSGKTDKHKSGIVVFFFFFCWWVSLHCFRHRCGLNASQGWWGAMCLDRFVCKSERSDTSAKLHALKCAQLFCASHLPRSRGRGCGK
jgi:hypothetical protein